VLLVEDVRVSSKVAELALRRERFTTMLVESGPDAVAAAKRHTFRVILMDIHLPGMSGIEATRLIREHEAANGRSPVLVLALTGNVAASDLETYRAVGIDGCIAKGRLLGDALQKALRANQAHPGKFVSIIDNDVKVY
jgi:CheY-like chemotaxis protein